MSDINKNRNTTGLICESLDYWFQCSPEQIAASKEKHNGRLVMESCLQRGDKKNAMGRIYPYPILLREFEAFQKLVDDKCAYMALDHPSQATVELKTACAIIDRQYWKKNNEGNMEWWGDVEILNTSLGKEVAAIVEQGKRVSVSSRGVGSVVYDSKRDADIVQDDFVIVTWDVVSQPSTHNANMILKEGYELHKNKYAYKRYIENKINLLKGIDLLSRGLYDDISNNQFD